MASAFLKMCVKEDTMVDFSKKATKRTRIIAAIISILLVVGMVIGLLVSIL